MRETYNKRDCLALLATKKDGGHYNITSLNGIDRWLEWKILGRSEEVISTAILSWDQLYAKISAMENIPVEIATPGAIDPKGMTDEEIMEFAKSGAKLP